MDLMFIVLVFQYQVKWRSFPQFIMRGLPSAAKAVKSALGSKPPMQLDRISTAADWHQV
jgi:hypothetical protein